MGFLMLPVILAILNFSPNPVASTPADAVIIYQADKFREYEMPEQCRAEGKSYCFHKDENYPTHKIANLLKDIHLLQVESKDSSDLIIGSRSGFEYDEPDCISNSTDKPIYYIIDEFDAVRVVVQMPGRFQQIYTTKWCLNEGRIRHDTPHFLKSTTLQQFKIECVTTTINYDFFVLSEDSDDKMEIVQAKGGIPVCCKCRYNVEY